MSHAEAVQLGQYTILEQIGKGGMSNVYRASQASMGREVAVKIMLGTLAQQDGASSERFYREVQVAEKLQHPHILPVCRQMQSAEDQLGERSVQLANQLGMREVLLSD